MWTVPSLDDAGEVVFPIGAYFTSVASAMRFYNLVNLRPDVIFSNSAGLYVSSLLFCPSASTHASLMHSIVGFALQCYPLAPHALLHMHASAVVVKLFADIMLWRYFDLNQSLAGLLPNHSQLT